MCDSVVDRVLDCCHNSWLRGRRLEIATPSRRKRWPTAVVCRGWEKCSRHFCPRYTVRLLLSLCLIMMIISVSGASNDDFTFAVGFQLQTFEWWLEALPLGYRSVLRTGWKKVVILDGELTHCTFYTVHQGHGGGRFVGKFRSIKRRRLPLKNDMKPRSHAFLIKIWRD